MLCTPEGSAASSFLSSRIQHLQAIFVLFRLPSSNVTHTERSHPNSHKQFIIRSFSCFALIFVPFIHIFMISIMLACMVFYLFCSRRDGYWSRPVMVPLRAIHILFYLRINQKMLVK